MASRLLAIVGSVTPPGRLLNATRWLLDSARADHRELEVELINLADQKIAFADGRPPEQYRDDTARIIASVRSAAGVVFASPVYRGSFTGALKNLLDHLPLESLGGKPVGIIAMGATQHHFLGVDWHLRDVLAWFGALVAPASVYLVSADFVDGELSDSAKRDLKDLADAVIKLREIAPAAGKFLGPRPLAGRRS
ncbi:MAG TPA: NADPH-dependent FMN reductase [Candidatus Binataceae bacterium]|nr:NADPH-dependent FMN reductase [Candidatus Binataceae bacterium]